MLRQSNTPSNFTFYNSSEQWFFKLLNSHFTVNNKKSITDDLSKQTHLQELFGLLRHQQMI